MLQQPERFRSLVTVRDGQLTAVTCTTCGCRLQADPASDEGWRHFGALAGRDAMGHRAPCVELAHDATGRAAIPA